MEDIGEVAVVATSIVNHTTHIDIRLFDRKNRKYQTMICGLSTVFGINFEELCRTLKKKLNCGCHTVEHREYGFVIVLTGDHREEVKKLIIQRGYAKADNITLHGV